MILLYLILVGVFGIAILWSTIKVMWVDGNMWRAKAESRTMNYIDQPAQRGNIYSSDGKILATTVPECDLYLDFSIRPKLGKRNQVLYDKNGDTIFFTPIVDSNYTKYLDSVCIILHEAFPDSSIAAFRNKIAKERVKPKRGGCIRIAKHVPYSDWDRICKFPGWSKGVVRYVDGKSVIHNKRFHTYGNMGECVIGFPTLSGNGFTGLEGYYDSILRGRDGLILCRRLTRGSWIPVSRGTYIPVSESDKVVTDSIPGHPVVDGLDIVSTIDTRLQDIAHYSLEKALRRMNGSQPQRSPFRPLRARFHLQAGAAHRHVQRLELHARHRHAAARRFQTVQCQEQGSARPWPAQRQIPPLESRGRVVERSLL